MKYSGIEWIGEMPDNWELIRLKDICEYKKEIVGKKSFEYERLALTLNGIIKRAKDDSEGLQPKEFDNYQIVRTNDFIFKMIDLQNVNTSRVGLSPYTGLVSPAYIRFVSRKDSQFNDFIYYYLLSLWHNRVFNSLGGDGVRSSLNATDMGNFVCPFPTEKMQRLIINYLKNKEINVDTLINNEQKQIELLENYKKAVIRDVVTHGINKAVSFKGCPIEWLDKIPSHWNCMPNKYVMHKIKIICEKYNNEKIVSLSTNGVIARDLLAGGKMPTSFDGYQFVYPGNLLMCLFDYDVTPRCIGLIKDFGLTSPAYSQFELFDIADAGYYYYYYLMIDYTKELLHLARNLRHSFTEDELGRVFVPVPPLEEQIKIRDYLNEKCSEIDQLINLKNKKIEKINEYKKSLVFEYVTGKKEVDA